MQNELGKKQAELDTLKVKYTLRNEVVNQFNRISPHWLQGMPMKMKYQCRILFQMESNVTERLKFIITNQMNISVVQFCEDMDVFVEQGARYARQDDFPDLESEDKMMRILESIGFKKGTMKKSIVALAFHFRNLHNTDYSRGDCKCYFLYFPSLQALTTENDISKFVNTYFDYEVVFNENVTLIENDSDEAGASSIPPKNIQAFVRFNKTIINQEGKEIKVLPILDQIHEEIVRKVITELEVETTTSNTAIAITVITSTKKLFMNQCDDMNTVPIILF